LPSTVLFSNQGQPVNYPDYASSPSYKGSSSLWIQGSTSWTQNVVVPEGATVNLLAITPGSGSGYLYFMDSDGQMYTYNYYFYPYSRMAFYADNPGRHIFSFAVNGMVSNQVIIDVTGTYIPPNNYLPPAYYPYYNGFYPGFYGFDQFGSPGSTGTTTGGNGVGSGTGGQVSGGDNGGKGTGDQTGGQVSSGDNGGKGTDNHTGGQTNGGDNGSNGVVKKDTKNDG
jgi:hypothetical protein